MEVVILLQAEAKEKNNGMPIGEFLIKAIGLYVIRKNRFQAKV